MQIIAHRKNTIAELSQTPPQFGIEVDIRSWGEELTIHHDPFVQGEAFTAWLKHYQHRLLILNVKEEGLEARLIELMNEHGIENYFFLDQSFPFLVKWAKLGEKRLAIRVSEYESIDTALSLKDKANWIWVDCFTQFPLNQNTAKQLKEANFKLCLVSPELQGRNAELEIPALQKLLKVENITPDAVCTKRPDLWQ
jgi:hypothetical protein